MLAGLVLNVRTTEERLGYPVDFAVPAFLERLDRSFKNDSIL